MRRNFAGSSPCSREAIVSQQERTTVDVEFNVVARSANPLNILCSDDLNAGPGLHRKSGGVSIRGAVRHFHNPLCHDRS
jgi:hypothetical protein